jgi:hypothetical protein
MEVLVELCYPPDTEKGLGRLRVVGDGLGEERLMVSGELPPECVPFVSVSTNGVRATVYNVEVLPLVGHMPTKSARKQ